jgi:hypothetical protein
MHNSHHSRTAFMVPALALIIFAPKSEANVIFSQDFSSSTSVSAYYNSDPTPGQWNSVLGSASINNGMLAFTRAGSNASFTRSKDFAPIPQALIYKFDLQVAGNSSAQTSAASWQVGSGFSASRNDLEGTSLVHSRLTLNLTSTPGTFAFSDGGVTHEFSGKQSITWIINNTSSPLQYLGPDGTRQSVAVDAWDLWVGNTEAFDDRPALTATRSLTELKFGFVAGSGTLSMDNFSIDDAPAVPEPAASGVFAAGFLAVVIFGVHWRYLRFTPFHPRCPARRTTSKVPRSSHSSA